MSTDFADVYFQDTDSIEIRHIEVVYLVVKYVGRLQLARKMAAVR